MVIEKSVKCYSVEINMFVECGRESPELKKILIEKGLNDTLGLVIHELEVKIE